MAVYSFDSYCRLNRYLLPTYSTIPKEGSGFSLETSVLKSFQALLAMSVACVDVPNDFYTSVRLLDVGYRSLNNRPCIFKSIFWGGLNVCS